MRYISQETRRIMGCDVILTLVSDTPDMSEIFEGLWRQIVDFDNRFSRFKPDSELSKLNKSAGKKIKITDELRLILLKTTETMEQTDGLFNPFILPALQSAGYIKSLESANQKLKTDDFSLLPKTVDHKISIDADWAEIPKNSAIDLGGIAKGFLAEKLATSLLETSINDFWISIGGDIAFSGRAQDNQPWSVAVESTKSTMEPTIQVSSLARYGVATSGVTKRNGLKANKPWHHIIDPRSGKPAKTDVLIASVICTDVVQADVLATCAVILGSAHAPRFLKSHSVLGYVIQTSKSVFRHASPTLNIYTPRQLVDGNS